MKPAHLVLDATPTVARRFIAPIAPSAPRRRSGLATGVAISVGLHLALGAALLFGGLRRPPVIAPEPAPMIVEFSPRAAPSPPEEVAPGPRLVERQASKPLPPVHQPARLAADAPEALAVAPPRPTAPADPGPAAPQTTAPPTPPAPPAAEAASNVRITWEGQVLAQLEKHRRYPPAARARRQQGVAWVRFRMDRKGQVIWSRLERSSGFGELDKAAVDTVRRAQPLPAIPADRADPTELVVPVEFFIKAD